MHGTNLPDLGPDYASEVTNASYQEIQRLAFWAKARGPTFYLIGGWAAWRYHQGLGSRDIDVIFQDQSILQAFLPEYYKENGYVKTGGLFHPGFHKPVRTSAGVFYIEIDAAEIGADCGYHEDRKVTLPYRLLERHSTEWNLAGEAVRIPSVGLLLLQKIKARRDRMWDLGHESIDPSQAAFLRSKVQKDNYDIQRLATLIPERAALQRISSSPECWELSAQTLSELGLLREGRV